MARIETWFEQDLKKPVVVHKLDSVFSQDAKGNLIGVKVFSDGVAVALTDSITGYCVLADGSTVPVSGSRSGNQASIVLPASAYNVLGPIMITVKNTGSDYATTLCAVAGLVVRSRTGSQVNPGSVVTDWTNQISAQLQAVQTAADNLGSVLAVPFSNLTAYSAGTYVMKDGNLYCFTTDHAAGDWNSSQVRNVKLANEVSDLKSALANIQQPTKNINKASVGRFFVQNGIIKESNAHSIGLATTIEVESNTNYAVSIFGIGNNIFHLYLFFYDSNNEYMSGSDLKYYNITKSKAFTTPASAKHLALYIYNANVDLPLSQDTHIQIEKGNTASDVYYPPYSARDANAENEIAKIKNNVVVVKNTFGSFLTDCFEIGNIVMGGNGWTYGIGSGPTRVRTKERTILRIKAGTVIGLFDYTDARYYVGMRQNDGVYENHGWLTADYIIPKDCDCVILITNRTETEQTSPVPLASLFFGYSMTDYFTQNKYIDYDNAVKNINHRGYNLVAPENTLPAYRLSKLMGFNIVETDVSFTSDGVPVCLHDATINRTARNADGSAISAQINISDITYEQALTYDFGVWKNAKYTGAKIPTLEQFLVLCKNVGLQAYVEIKTDQTYTESQIHGLMNIAKKTGMYDRVTWISFLPAYLAYVKSYDPKAKMIYVVSAVTNEVISNANALKQNGNLIAIDAQFSALDSEGIQRCIDADIPLEIWTINSETNILNLDPYVTGVTSDYMIAGKVLYERNIYLD